MRLDAFEAADTLSLTLSHREVGEGTLHSPLSHSSMKRARVSVFDLFALSKH
jgi:hypothetical protein